MCLPLKILLLCFSLVLVSCGSVTVRQTAKSSITPRSSIYVVRPDDSDRDIDKFINDAFMRRGYHVSAGPHAQMPANTSHYVNYVDRWYWDMAMYLVSLDVIVHDRKSGMMVGAGTYKNSVFHGFPNPPNTADRVVGQILGETED